MGIRRSQNIRSVRDIRTYSGRVDTGGVPYLGYLKIGCLEMEKARREKERDGALARSETSIPGSTILKLRKA